MAIELFCNWVKRAKNGAYCEAIFAEHFGVDVAQDVDFIRPWWPNSDANFVVRFPSGVVIEWDNDDRQWRFLGIDGAPKHCGYNSREITDFTSIKKECSIIRSRRQLERRVAELEEENATIRLFPGGPHYLEALRRFDALRGVPNEQ